MVLRYKKIASKILVKGKKKSTEIKQVIYHPLRKQLSHLILEAKQDRAHKYLDGKYSKLLNDYKHLIYQICVSILCKINHIKD